MRKHGGAYVMGRRRFGAVACCLGSLGALRLVTGCGVDPIDAGTDTETDAESETDAGETTDPSAGPATSDSSTSEGGTTDDPGETTGEGSTGGFACEPSPPDIEGPYYRPQIPIGGELDIHGDEGVPLILGGVVTDTDCAPVEGAIVELWHATPVLPDGQPGDVNATYDSTEEYRYYGQVATDSEGRYEFTTLKPGWYLNGPEYRPAHLHLKLWVDGQERLTTQVYFAGDPFNAGDNWYNPDMEIDPDADGQATLDLTVPP